MSKPIQINIPSPCHEDWDKMTPVEQGRFCNSCQKVVTDFTNFTDAQLYSFFSKRTEEVCGRFYNHQLNRDIHIPTQPHSRLYQYFIGFGLTLLFTQLPETSLRAQAPYAATKAYSNNKINDSGNEIATIKGKVLDEDKKPMIGAVITAYISDKQVAGGITDEDGNYKISIYTADATKCNVVFKYSSYFPKTFADILVYPNQTVTVNAQMELDTTKSNDLFIISGGKVPLQMDTTRVNIPRDGTAQVPLIDPFEPNKTIIDSKEIDHRAH